MMRDDSATKRTIKLTFYVAGNGQFSRQARDNLSKLIDTIKGGAEVKLKIIDVMKKPEAALSQGIFTTPALIADIDDDCVRFIGDLSQQEKVLAALNLQSS